MAAAREGGMAVAPMGAVKVASSVAVKEEWMVVAPMEAVKVEETVVQKEVLKAEPMAG